MFLKIHIYLGKRREEKPRVEPKQQSAGKGPDEGYAAPESWALRAG